MAKESPAFQFYAQDFLVGTADMSCAEVGAYIRLLAYEWTKGGLPNDDEKLCRLAGCDGNAIASIRHKFRIDSAGMLVNDRLEQVRQAQQEYREQQAKNARKGWKKRVGYATAMPPHSDGNADPDAKHHAKAMPNGCSSSSSSIVSKESNSDAGDEAVKRRSKVTRSQAEALYQAYPRRVGKEAAIKAIVRAVGRLAKTMDDPLGYLTNRVYAYANSWAGQRQDQEFIPHPSTWFNQGRYDDDVGEWEEQKSTGDSDTSDFPPRLSAEQVDALMDRMEAECSQQNSIPFPTSYEASDAG